MPKPVNLIVRAGTMASFVKLALGNPRSAAILAVLGSFALFSPCEIGPNPDDRP
jgi:hypothetical protein